MIKFTPYPICSKCSYEETDIGYYKYAPRSEDYPGDFLNVTCKRCKYVFKMHTKDYVEEDND